MNDRPVRFGLIGAGGIAQSYLHAFGAAQRAQLIAIADVRPEAAAALAEPLGIPSYGSHTELLKKELLHAVVVCTPPASHEMICRDALAARVNVLCEKPLAIDSDSARRMLAAAKRTGCTLTMASKFRYVADVAEAKRLVDSGAIGQVVLFENAFTSKVDMRNRWNSRAEISGGGVLIDNGTHSVDIMRFFLGPLAELQVIEGQRTQGLAVEETVRIMVVSTSGVMGSIDLSWSINKELPSYINIYGSEGTISVGWRQSQYRPSGQDWVTFGSGYDKLQAFRAQLDNFAAHLRGDEPLVISPDDALASVEVVETAYQALHRSQWTSIFPGLAEGETTGSDAEVARK